MTKQEGIEKMILALTRKDRRGVKNDFHKVARDENIDEEIIEMVLRSMQNSKNYISAEPSLNICNVSVTQVGIDYANSLREKLYKELCIPYEPEDNFDSPIEQTCELVFSWHKEDNNHIVIWKNSLFSKNPKNLHVAKMKLTNEGIIQPFDTLTEHRTMLNSDYYSFASYADCIKLKQEQKSPFHITTINTVGNKNTISNHSTNSPIATEKATDKNWMLKAVSWVGEKIANHFIAIIAPLVIAAIGYKSCQKQQNQEAPLKTINTIGIDSASVRDSLER